MITSITIEDAVGEHAVLERELSGHQSTISSQLYTSYFTVWTLLTCDFKAVVQFYCDTSFFVCLLTALYLLSPT